MNHISSDVLEIEGEKQLLIGLFVGLEGEEWFDVMLWIELQLKKNGNSMAARVSGYLPNQTGVDTFLKVDDVVAISFA
jgi:hypothetical protein